MPIGPSRPLNLAKPESIDIRQAARYFGARGEADSATLTLLKKCAAPLLAATLGTVIHLIGGILGMLTMLALGYLGSTELLTPTNVLLYQLIWMIPGFLVTEWTRAV